MKHRSTVAHISQLASTGHEENSYNKDIRTLVSVVLHSLRTSGIYIGSMYIYVLQSCRLETGQTAESRSSRRCVLNANSRCISVALSKRQDLKHGKRQLLLHLRKGGREEPHCIIR